MFLLPILGAVLVSRGGCLRRQENYRLPQPIHGYFLLSHSGI